MTVADTAEVASAFPRRLLPLARWMRALAVAAGMTGERMLIGRMMAWRLVLAVLKRTLPIAGLIRLVGMWPPRARTEGGPRRVVELAGAVCRLRLARSENNCLERSLIAYRYLCGHHPRPELMIGVWRTSGMVKGHAWVVLAGEPLGEPPGALAGLTPLTSFPAGGRA